ncbi:mannitol-1-phosphate 5-dehydrogenase [Falsarthrobacter nasiphocae]|uniref:Mannitol-1-phosphate 5-dehydrogenase n=1 Tax=Falsarthrobacter nasiphocae TaxID=189863 RepID=A0AAE4C8H5_9MICC|nr:mannitol-1-phosphate 5-dehydrogenase [Falsarthrobacter nasiphocae]MDR6892420.1 mannitol-1-phosphate 5-dehydrogenase [Falsarthrobacter nasiphocae]
MKAVHFGAGNIGRGFVGALLHGAGAEIVFADVNAELIEALKNADSYTVHEVGVESRDVTVSGFTGVNSATEAERLTREIASADLVTCAVGPTVLKFIAPAIAEGLKARGADQGPLAVMACENAINATDTLAEYIAEHVPAEELASRAVFANTAVDRIVPDQAAGQGLDVTVETYFEWAVESAPFGDNRPEIPGVTWVEDLGPYIERKLFTVNTGHATSAYHGYAAGFEKLSDALADPDVRARVESVLAETKGLLVAKHGFAPEEQQAYIEKILVRFANPHLPDTVVRVGRAPLRKLSRKERFIGPAAEAAERGLGTRALVETVAAALRFDPPSDPEAAAMAADLSSLSSTEFVEKVTGLTPEHPLFEAVEAEVRDAQQRVS